MPNEPHQSRARVAGVAARAIATAAASAAAASACASASASAAASLAALAALLAADSRGTKARGFFPQGDELAVRKWPMPVDRTLVRA